MGIDLTDTIEVANKVRVRKGHLEGASGMEVRERQGCILGGT